MAKGCYVGPISTIKIDDTNISDHFEVTNSTYGFEWTTVNGSKCLAPTNYDAGRSTATMTLKAKCNMDRLYLKYTYNIDDLDSGVTFKVGSTYVLDGASGTESNIVYNSGALKAGDIITFSYTNMVNSINPSTHSVVFTDLRILSDPYAKKVKNIYVGVPTTVPIYSTQRKEVIINGNNVTDFFEVTNSQYYFTVSTPTSAIFKPNNLGVNSSTATTSWKLKQDVTNVSFRYQYTTEANYDKFTIKKDSTTIMGPASGSNSLTGLNAGDCPAGTVFTFSYTKDGSQSASGENVLFETFSFTTDVKTQIGSEVKQIARKIKKGYVGVGGVAKLCYRYSKH